MQCEKKEILANLHLVDLLTSIEYQVSITLLKRGRSPRIKAWLVPHWQASCAFSLSSEWKLHADRPEGSSMDYHGTKERLVAQRRVTVCRPLVSVDFS